MSNLTIIPNGESAVTVNQLALFIESREVQKAKETSKDLLADIAESLKRMKRVASKNKDFIINKLYRDIPLATFKFICNQYKVDYEYSWDSFQTFIHIPNGYIKLKSEPTKLALQEIETIAVAENREGGAK
jgi:hypothetical protein